MARLREVGALLSAAVIASLASGCTAAAAAGATAVAGAAAAVTAQCYDRVEVRLLDIASGRRACDARVVAQSRDGDEVRFTSCFHAALDAGEWQVRAEQTGYTTATTTLVVPDTPGCDAAVQTIELSLVPTGYRRVEPAAPPASAVSAPVAAPSPPRSVQAPPVTPEPAPSAATPASATDAPVPSADVPPATPPTPPSAAPAPAAPPAPSAPTAPAPPPSARFPSPSPSP